MFEKIREQIYGVKLPKVEAKKIVENQYSPILAFLVVAILGITSYIYYSGYKEGLINSDSLDPKQKSAFAIEGSEVDQEDVNNDGVSKMEIVPSSTVTGNNLGFVEDPDRIGIIYQRTSPPPGLEGAECFVIPAGGTVYGAIKVGGDPSTTQDTPNAEVIINGRVVEFDTRPKPEDWPEAVQNVPIGTIACSF